MLPINNKLVKNIAELKALCLGYKNQNKKVVLTNGCFDILHSGHTYILEKSKELGDVLIVALNSDISIKNIKQKNRPIIEEQDRAYMLSCLISVDHIIIFNEETPEKLICEIIPDILVKGSDYKDKKIAGEECMKKNNKKIILIDLLESKSTSSIINKISET
tara:strand:+ start:379 stop:864 length:486 start_codon:yes stop_codon:yes gene_type:complete